MLVVVLLNGILLWQIQADRERTLALHADRLEGLSVVLAADADATLRAGLGVLASSARLIRDQGGIDRMDEASLHRVLRQQLMPFPQHEGMSFQEMWAVNTAGEIVAVSNQLPMQRVSVADRDYFRHHRATPGSEPYLSPQLASRTTQLPIIPTTVRLEDAQGRFAGLLGVTLQVRYFERTYSLIKRFPGTSIALLRQNGQVLFRYPASDVQHPASPKDADQMQGILGHSQGHLQIQSSLYDGEPRLIGFRKGQQFPLIALVTEKKSDVLAQWRRNSLVYGLAGLLACALVIGFGVFSVGQLRQLDRLVHLSLHDVLTGLPNRRYLDRQLATEWQRMARTRQSFSLLFIDIDHFKRYNDHYGHHNGDRCLRQVAQAMRNEIKRAGDALVRYGGEEFVCILPNTELAGAHQFGQSLLDAVTRLQLPHAKSPTAPIVTVSIGVVSALPRPGNDVEAVLRSADVALYEAKAAGRNRVHSLQNVILPPDEAGITMPGSDS